MPVAEAETFDVGVVSVPEPSAALTVTLGEDERVVNEPPATDFSLLCQVWAPVEEVTVAPEPPPLVSPYVIVAVAPPASVRLETVIVWLAAETAPVLEVVYPFVAAVVLGADQPLGTSIVTEPLEIPPVAAV